MKKTNKILFALILSLLMAVALSFCALAEEYYSPGDVNQDGEINAKDAVLLAQYLAGWDVSLCNHPSIQHYEAKDASCNEDGNIEYWQCQHCKMCASDDDLKNEISETDIVIKASHTPNEQGNKCVVCGELLSYTEGLTYRLINNDSEYEVAGIGTATDLDIIIPNQYNGKPVTGIGYQAFKNCSSLTSVTIPDSVTSIGERAFYYCSSLTSINIPNNVTNISIGAFAFTALKTVNIPRSVTTIGMSAFMKCYSLTSITIPDNVTSIREYAFSECSNLASVTIGNGTTYIGGRAFYNCPAVTKDSGIHYVDGWVVDSDENITTANFKNDTIGIGYNALFKRTSLVSITIPNSLKYINSYAFGGCDALKTAVIPDSVINIDQEAFAGCSALTSVTIGNGVKSLEMYAFVNCNNLTFVAIGNGIEYLGYGVFQNDTTLTKINYSGTIEQWKAIEKDTKWKNNSGNFTVYCTNGTLSKEEA